MILTRGQAYVVTYSHLFSFTFSSRITQRSFFLVVTSIRDPVTRNVRRTCRSLPFDYMSQIPPFLIISFTGPLVLRISIATLLPEWFWHLDGNSFSGKKGQIGNRTAEGGGMDGNIARFVSGRYLSIGFLTLPRPD